LSDPGANATVPGPGRGARTGATLAGALALLLLGDGPAYLPAEDWTPAGVRNRLFALARTHPRDQRRRPGASCYKETDIPLRMEYVCPVCHGRTFYALLGPGAPVSGKRLELQALLEGLEGCRAKASAIRGLAVSLDESRLCSRCSPPGVDPDLGLVVRTADGREIRTWGCRDHDLDLLAAFTEGAILLTGEDAGYAWPMPLKESLPRLRILLGSP